MDGEVLLREYEAPHEAELTAAYLREHGVPARVQENVLTNLNPLWGMVTGGTRLFVAARDGSRARQLVGELLALHRLDQREQAFGNPERRARLEGDDAARRALAAAVLGTFLLPVVTHLYSLWLAGPLARNVLSRKGRRHRRAALFIDLAVLALAAVLLTLRV